MKTHSKKRSLNTSVYLFTIMPNRALPNHVQPALLCSSSPMLHSLTADPEDPIRPISDPVSDPLQPTRDPDIIDPNEPDMPRKDPILPGEEGEIEDPDYPERPLRDPLAPDEEDEIIDPDYPEGPGRNPNVPEEEGTEFDPDRRTTDPMRSDERGGVTNTNSDELF